MKPSEPFRQAAVCACGSHGFIGLTQGAVALFSPEDIQQVEGRRWFLAKRKRGLRYAISGKTMHRVITEEFTPHVDHRDGDGLNNTRSNLRPCSAAENVRSRRPQLGSATGLKGVYPSQGKYRVRLSFDGVMRNYGTFDSPEAAARAYDKAALALHGEFARTNAMMGLLP